MSDYLLSVLGCGEAFDHELGNTSFFLETPSQSCLFDCGYLIPRVLWSRGLADKIDTIFVTHFHADHFLGIVPLIARFWEDKRLKPLNIIGPFETARKIQHGVELGYPGLLKKLPFELDLMDHKGVELNWHGMELSFAPTGHSIVNHSIRVSINQASFMISGDGKPTSCSVELAKDTDLIFQETYGAEANIPTHGSLEDIRRYLESSDGRVGMTHVSRHEKGSRPYQDFLKLYKDRCFLAEPGTSFPL